MSKQVDLHRKRRMPERGQTPQAASFEPDALSRAPLPPGHGHDFRNLSIFPKLEVNEPGDRSEREADQTATQVVARLALANQPSLQREEEEEKRQRKPQPALTSAFLPVSPLGLQRQRAEGLREEEHQHAPNPPVNLLSLRAAEIQRQCAACEQEEAQQEGKSPQSESVPAVQRAPADGGFAVEPDIEASIEGKRGSGSPLASQVRGSMEGAFGADFSGVRVHTDSPSDALNQSLSARAFTTGSDIFFRSGEYSPGSQSGQELLAHELTHVVQQGGAATGGVQTQPQEEIQRKLAEGVRSAPLPTRLPNPLLRSFAARDVSAPSPVSQPDAPGTETSPAPPQSDLGHNFTMARLYPQTQPGEYGQATAEGRRLLSQGLPPVGLQTGGQAQRGLIQTWKLPGGGDAPPPPDPSQVVGDVTNTVENAAGAAPAAAQDAGNAAVGAAGAAPEATDVANTPSPAGPIPIPYPNVEAGSAAEGAAGAAPGASGAIGGIAGGIAGVVGGVKEGVEQGIGGVIGGIGEGIGAAGGALANGASAATGGAIGGAASAGGSVQGSAGAAGGVGASGGIGGFTGNLGISGGVQVSGDLSAAGSAAAGAVGNVGAAFDKGGVGAGASAALDAVGNVAASGGFDVTGGVSVSGGVSGNGVDVGGGAAAGGSVGARGGFAAGGAGSAGGGAAGGVSDNGASAGVSGGGAAGGAASGGASAGGAAGAAAAIKGSAALGGLDLGAGAAAGGSAGSGASVTGAVAGAKSADASGSAGIGIGGGAGGGAAANGKEGASGGGAGGGVAGGNALTALGGNAGAAGAALLGSGALLAAQLGGQEGGGGSAPDAGPAPMMPETPAGAQAAAQILQAVETEKSAFCQDVQAQRAATLADAEGKAQALAAKTEAKTQAITASIDSKKAEILSKFSETRAAILAQMESRKATARADGDKALASLQTAVETKRKAALDAAEESASQTEKTGQTEAERATNESNASAGRVNATAAAESNKYGDTPKAKAAAAQAIQKVAAELVGKIRANGSDQAKQARDTANKAAQGFRDSGKQLAASLGGSTAQVEQTIRQSVEGAVSRIDTVGKQHLETLTGLQTQALSSLEAAKAQTIPAIRQAGEAAQAGARQAGEALALQMDALQDTVLQQMSDGANRVIDQLHQAEQSGKLNGKAALEAAQGTSEPLRQGRAQLTSLLMEKVNAAQTQLGALETTFGNEIDGAEQKLNGTLGGVATTTTSGLAQLQTELQQLFDQALNSGREAQQKAVSQYGDGVDQKINEAKQKWGQERDKVQAGIRADIDKSLKANQEAEQKAPAEFAKAGKEAAESAEDSIAMGILKGVGKVLLGLVILVALAAVIYGIAAGLAALGVCAAIPFAIALAIAAVILLIVMFVLAVIQRAKEMDSVLPADRSFWLCLAAGFAVVFIALGDIVGITPIIEGITGQTAITQKPLNKEERAEKITEGVLSLLLLFLGGRIFKGFKGAGETGDPTVDPLKGGDPTVDPSKPVDPTVDPNKPTDPNVDPNKPDTPSDPNLGFENGKRVLAEEPTADGKHKLKVLEDGDCLYCSDCGRLQKEYAVELTDPKNADVLAELENADKISNPKLKAKRMAQIEAKLEQLRKDNPNPIDPKAARAARIQLLARDPAHGGKVTPGSLREAEVAVSLEESSKVSGPVQRDPTGAADFLDGSGKPWDVKGFNSHQPPSSGGFDLATDAGKIDSSLALGEDVMVDTGQMSAADVTALKAEGVKRGWGDKVQFFP